MDQQAMTGGWPNFRAEPVDHEALNYFSTFFPDNQITDIPADLTITDEAWINLMVIHILHTEFEDRLSDHVL